jgi:hypothetical protein
MVRTFLIRSSGGIQLYEAFPVRLVRLDTATGGRLRSRHESVTYDRPTRGRAHDAPCGAADLGACCPTDHGARRGRTTNQRLRGARADPGAHGRSGSRWR